MKIRLNDIRLFCRHGVLEDEAKIGAWFRVSICATTAQEMASQTDSLEHTLNYAHMADIVREEMFTTSQLIEHVAGRIGRRLMKEMTDIDNLTVIVTKENPPIGMECQSASVEMEWKR